MFKFTGGLLPSSFLVLNQILLHAFGPIAVDSSAFHRYSGLWFSVFFDQKPLAAHKKNQNFPFKAHALGYHPLQSLILARTPASIILPSFLQVIKKDFLSSELTLNFLISQLFCISIYNHMSLYPQLSGQLLHFALIPEMFLHKYLVDE